MKGLLISILLLFSFNNLFSQSYSYSYVDPCTGKVKSLNIPSGGNPITVNYYGTVAQFNGNDFNNGTFAAWINSVSEANSSQPCGEVVTLLTTNINMVVAQNVVSTVMNVTSIANMAQSMSAMGSGMSDGIGNSVNNSESGGKGSSKKDKKNGESNGNNNGNGSVPGNNNNSGGQSGSTDGQTQGSQGQGSQINSNNGNGSQSTGSNGASTGNGSTTNGNGNTAGGSNGNGQTNATGQGQGGTVNPGSSGSTNTGTSTGSNSGSGAAGSTNNPGSGTAGSGTSGGSSSETPGSSNPGSGSAGTETPGTGSGTTGSGTTGSGTTGSGTTGSGSTTNGGSGTGTNGTGGTTPGGQESTGTAKNGGNGSSSNGISNSISNSEDNSGNGGSGGKGGSKTRTGSIIGTGDIVAVRSAEDASAANQYRFTASLTHANTKNTKVTGLLANFTTGTNNTNVTLYKAWVIPKSQWTIIAANSSMMNFERDFFNTTTTLASKKFKGNWKKLTVMGGLNYTMGNLGETKFGNLSAVGGGFYAYNIGKSKKLSGSILCLAVYSPFTQFFEGQWWESGTLLVPFNSWDYSITKKFKFNVSISGVYQVNQNMLNYQVLTGGKILL